MRAIQERLNLPNEADTEYAYRTIREEVEKAITDLEDRNDPDISVTAIYNDNSSITDFLDHGYLEIILRGKYAAPLKELYANEQKKIESAKRRQEKIVDAAKARNLAKKMETEEKKSSGDEA